jgi:hypothetical protein
LTAARAIRGEDGGPLGVWAVGPVIGFAAVLAAFTLLPEHGCDRLAFLAVAGLATLLAIGAGVWRFEGLYRHERAGEGEEGVRDAPPPPSRRSVVVTLLAALAVLVALAIIGGGQVLTTEVFFVFVLGAFATFIAFLMVAAGCLGRIRADEVGMALPVYLVGSGLFVYPAMIDLAASFSSGSWGC